MLSDFFLPTRNDPLDALVVQPTEFTSIVEPSIAENYLHQIIRLAVLASGVSVQVHLLLIFSA